MLVAAWYIAPPGLTRADIYTPFLIVLGACALYALIWTYGVKRVNPWKPVEPEQLMAVEGVTGE
jgi:hypothetical protein